jgi:leucyl aminopeptidase
MLTKHLPWIGLAALTLSTTLQAAQPTHIIAAPKCLIAAENTPHMLADSQNFAVIEADDTAIENMIERKYAAKTPCGNFKDVTMKWEHFQNSRRSNKTNVDFLASLTTPSKRMLEKKTYTIRHTKETTQLINQVDPQWIWNTLTVFSDVNERHANSEQGVRTANWLHTQITGMAEAAGRQDVTAYFVQTTGYRQPSLVVKVGKGNEPGIVISGHMDTVKDKRQRRPGADDDGSGSMVTMEAARTIITSGMTFKRPIYFIWYAAEEEGLVGSTNVIADFAAKNVAIEAAMHFDMTGYAYRNESTLWVLDDYVDKNLTTFIGKLITEYTKRTVGHTACGYACSDHASWYDASIPVSAPTEASYRDSNPNLHTQNDTIDKLSMEHMGDFAKLAVAFAVELAEPA